MPKCKVCGSRVQEGATKCPMCGVAIAGAQSQPTAPQKPAAQKPNPTPVQPQPQPTPSQPSHKPQQPSSSYTPPTQNNGGCFSKIISIAITIIIIVVILLFIRNGCDAAGGSSTGTSYSQPQQQKAAYAKIDCELTGKADDLEWNLFGLNVALQMNVLEQHELTQADKNAIQYAINYIEKNMQPLENKGVYQVMLYKDYYSEHDKSGWIMFLRYNRTIEDFDAVIARF